MRPLHQLHARVREAFRSRFGRDPQTVVRAPGRANLLGAHVDYNEGFVLPGAVDRSVWLAAATAPGSVCSIAALDRGQTAVVDLASLPPPVPERAEQSVVWVDYPAGIAWALQEKDHRLRAIDAVFTSSVPIGAGVSSSAAVEIAFLMAWEQLSGFAVDGLTKARTAQRAENAYLGVGSGIMDPFASMHGEAGRLLFLDCRSCEHQTLPLPMGSAVVIADTGTRRELALSGFNDRRSQCGHALNLLRRDLPDIRALRDVTPEQLWPLLAGLPHPLGLRARHVVEECRRALAGRDALRRNDLAAFGALMRASHESSRDLYEVSTPELDLLAETAWSVEGCYGARVTGAGFGGCIVALAAGQTVAALSTRLREAFERRFARRPEIYACRIGQGAEVVEYP